MYKSHIFRSRSRYTRNAKKRHYFSEFLVYINYISFFYFVFSVIYAVIYPQIQLCKLHKNNRIDTAKQAIAAGT